MHLFINGSKMIQKIGSINYQLYSTGSLSWVVLLTESPGLRVLLLINLNDDALPVVDNPDVPPLLPPLHNLVQGAIHKLQCQQGFLHHHSDRGMGSLTCP